tara:strand:+ start:1574 stop:1738 length:165 start_codon:yes stop_codon:yes gene_type:complete
MTEPLVPNQVDDLEKKIKELETKLKDQDKILANFKKFYNGWPNHKTQLGIKDEV